MRFAQNKTVAVVSFALILAGIAMNFAPRYLVYSKKPYKADVIVLFTGGNNKTRMMEAEELLREGYAHYLLIPNSGELQELMPNGRLVSLDHDILKGKAFSNMQKYSNFRYYYEKTHLEVLEAKRMMDDMGLAAAIMVSSPYHMRRIRMISRMVFGEQARLFSYVPTRYEPVPSGLFGLHAQDIKFIFEEYVKICWFSLYAGVV